LTIDCTADYTEKEFIGITFDCTMGDYGEMSTAETNSGNKGAEARTPSLHQKGTNPNNRQTMILQSTLCTLTNIWSRGE
jgi:hypothetical protein